MIFSPLNKIKLPFTYIAAIPRSGSTLLCGLLTSRPDSLILSEPGIQRGFYHNEQQYENFKIPDYTSLKKYELQPKKMVRHFSRNISPDIYKNYKHIGIKECFHDNWQLYSRYFNKVNYLVLARDPRDILLSIYDYGTNDPKHKSMWMDRGVEYIAKRLNQVWKQQKEILKLANCLPIRYEDICADPEATLLKIQEFLKMESFTPSEPSSAIKQYPSRRWEIDKSKGRITNSSTFRWKKELKIYSEDLDYITLLMNEYVNYWQYKDE